MNKSLTALEQQKGTITDRIFIFWWTIPLRKLWGKYPYHFSIFAWQSLYSLIASRPLERKHRVMFYIISLKIFYML